MQELSLFCCCLFFPSEGAIKLPPPPQYILEILIQRLKVNTCKRMTESKQDQGRCSLGFHRVRVEFWLESMSEKQEAGSLSEHSVIQDLRDPWHF